LTTLPEEVKKKMLKTGISRKKKQAKEEEAP
jgi:hypothetical protein